jgi:hypothetical protein
MAEIMITSFFTRGGIPATNIETLTPGYPLVRVWEVSSGSPAGDVFVGQFNMSPMEDGSNDDGFYKYEFTSSDGYDETKTYVFRSEGGSSLPPHEQYQVARFEPDPDITVNVDVDDIADAVWDEPRADHLIPGSTGEGLSQIKADTSDIIDKLYLDANSVLEVTQLLLKLEAGRTKIDPVNHTLTVFDEDCTTPLRVFDLLDSTGNPSVSEVCERVPVTKGSSDNTTITDVCP